MPGSACQCPVLVVDTSSLKPTADVCCRNSVKLKNDDATALRGMARRFMEFCDSYSPHLIQQGMKSFDPARCYLSGLMGTQRRKNIETIENDVADSDYQGVKQFISSSPWSHDNLMDLPGGDAVAIQGDKDEAALIIDESSFLKRARPPTWSRLRGKKALDPDGSGRTFSVG